MVAAEESSYPNKGYVTHYIEPEHLNDGVVDVYLCGPPPMVDAVRKYLADQGIDAGELLLREVLRHAAWSARSASRTSRSSTRRGVRRPDGPRARGGPARGGRLSAEQLAEYRRLAEATGQYIKDGHFTDPAGFRETNSAFHLFPIEATGNDD